MPQVVELPPIGQDARGALVALVRVCKDLPAKGESFREFRTRLRAAKLWDRDRPGVLLRFLGTGGALVMPSVFMQELAAASGDDATASAVLDRLWHLNPLLGKAVLELVGQRAYGKDEIYKYLASAAYSAAACRRGPRSRPGCRSRSACGLLADPLGIAVAPGPRAERYVALGTTLDVDEFLAEDRPEPEPVIPSVTEDDAAPVVEPAVAGTARSRSRPAAVAVGGSAAARAAAPLVGRRRAVPARPQATVVPTSRFASRASPTTCSTRPASASPAGGADAPRARRAAAPVPKPSDFGLDAEAWVEGADEVVYRVAVAAALAFRLDRDRAAVVATFSALDKAGVLGDLYQGTVPENLPAQVDARALMLASLAARRCAEVPELASQLDGRANAAEAFASLDAALGRGLFRTELFWNMDMLAKLGVLRYDDLGDVTVTPHRIVRDTLFRLGFIATPYASDGPSLTAATRAARRAVPDGPADEILATFALACGCAYDCTYRKTCDYPCRERLE